MSGPTESEPPPQDAEDAGGVLGNLPRTRPQRSSPRRAAARAKAQARKPAGQGPAIGSGAEAEVHANGHNGAGGDPRGPSNGSRPRQARAGGTTAKTPAGPPAKAKARGGSARPQSATATKARAGAAKERATKARPDARRAAARPRPTTARSRGANASATPVPKQGFECESERTSRTVHPPGGAEIVTSVAEMVGELAKAGVSAGERLLKDAFSRLPL